MFATWHTYSVTFNSNERFQVEYSDTLLVRKSKLSCNTSRNAPHEEDSVKDSPTSAPEGRVSEAASASAHKRQLAMPELCAEAESRSSPQRASQSRWEGHRR